MERPPPPPPFLQNPFLTPTMARPSPFQQNPFQTFPPYMQPPLPQQFQLQTSNEARQSNLHGFKYDVFLSFRGADTRKGFTDHLYHSLIEANINTYKDDAEMEYGQEIGPACLKAIEDSKFCIIVFSKNFASSTWCLEELEHILRCKRAGEIRPVFYDMDPSDVESQTGSFEEAFEKHAEYFKDDLEKVALWRKALSFVVNLKGLVLKDHEDGHEARNIRNIVKEISDKLDPVKLEVAIHRVDLERPAEEVIDLLGDLSGDILMVSIYGMAGVGKTTIAKEVYNLIADKFEGSSFLEKVSDKLSRDRSFAAELQAQLLSDILRREFGKISVVDQGLSLVKKRLQGRKLFIVLDGVDELGHLYPIIGNCEWLSPGSRVIITTRIEDFSNSTIAAYKQYGVKELDPLMSLELLCLHAFGATRPPKIYTDCVQKILIYAGGMPLALTVLGSSLCGQDVDVWNCRVEKLEMIADKDIQQVLETSYYSLDDINKALFLDIACFFDGEDINYVIDILKECGRFPIDGINTLIKRCLVSVSPKDRLSMHLLLRDMGRDIVRRESSIPGKRSRIWHYEEAIEVLKDETGEIEVEGLIIDRKVSFDAPIRTKAFKKMKRLKFLQLNYVPVIGSFHYFSRNLRWLRWHGFSFENIPDEFYLGNMVSIDMRYSNLKVFSQKLKSMMKLKYLDLSHSQQFSQSPDFDSTPDLKELILQDCIKLEEIDDSIELLKHINTLDFLGCKGLKKLPKGFYKLLPLKLRLEGCCELKKIAGYYKMKAVVPGDNIIEKVLNISYMFNQLYIQVTGINFITKTVHTSPIQAIYEGGTYNVYLPAYPSHFYHQNVGSEIFLEVPQVKKGSRIVGCIVSVILATMDYTPQMFRRIHVEYCSKSKLYWKDYVSRFAFIANYNLRSTLWLSYWPLGKYIGQSDVIWNEINGGETMKVTITVTPETRVQNCGVHFIYEDEQDQSSLSNDIALLSRDCLNYSKCLCGQSDIFGVMKMGDNFTFYGESFGWSSKDVRWQSRELTEEDDS